jgi:hypothetical protein
MPVITRSQSRFAKGLLGADYFKTKFYRANSPEHCEVDLYD